jgi:hypothetical protein
MESQNVFLFTFCLANYYFSVNFEITFKKLLKTSGKIVLARDKYQEMAYYAHLFYLVLNAHPNSHNSVVFGCIIDQPAWTDHRSLSLS